MDQAGKVSTIWEREQFWSDTISIQSWDWAEPSVQQDMKSVPYEPV